MKKPLSKKRNNKVLIYIIIIFTILLSTVIYSFSYGVELPYKEPYFRNDPLTLNGAANLIDTIDTNRNIVISPFNIYNSLNYLYKGTDNISNIEIRNYTGYTYNKYNDYITNMNINNKISLKEETEVDKLYKEQIDIILTNKYNKLTINEINNLKLPKQKEIINIIVKTNLIYDNLTNKNNYSIKYLKEVTANKKQLSYKPYDIKTELDKIINNYESYTLNKEIVNINKLYLNNNFYNEKNITNNYNDIKFIDFLKDYSLINDDIKTITDDKIKFYIDDHISSKNDNIYLNTLIFNMEWETNYNPKYNTNIEFITHNKEIQITEALQENIYSYLDNGYAKGFKKQFKDNKYSFIAILPNDINTTNISSINIESLLDSEVTNESINVIIPKFNITYNLDLNNLYNKLNMSSLTTTKSNFKNMINEDFNLDYNYQKINISIGEKGTYNSSYKIQELETFTTYTNQKKLIFNRPFFYLIINNETKDCLFIGKIMEV